MGMSGIENHGKGDRVRIGKTKPLVGERDPKNDLISTNKDRFAANHHLPRILRERHSVEKNGHNQSGLISASSRMSCSARSSPGTTFRMSDSSLGQPFVTTSCMMAR